MKLVFYNAFKTWNPIFWLVALWTGGKYYHVEMYFDYSEHLVLTASFIKNRVVIEKLDTSRKEIEFVNISESQNLLTLSQTDSDIFQEAIKLITKDIKYDYLGLLGFVFRSNDFDDKKKLFCSEMTTELLMKYFNMEFSKKPHRMSPSRLYKEIQKHVL